MKRLLCILVFIFIFPAFSQAFEYWAQFVIGGGYACKVIITNQTDLPWSGTIWIRRGDDKVWQGNWKLNGQDFTAYTGVIISLEANETMAYSFEGDHVARSGYLEIEGDLNSYTSDLSISYFYEVWSTDGRLLDSIGSPPSPGEMNLCFPLRGLKTTGGL